MCLFIMQYGLFYTLKGAILQLIVRHTFIMC